ncbi:hypothetical protein [Bradyrhizobium sp. CCGB20]|uniref:hypothetical protein n=1 Tax=unclassified Bradyrhizobium TaxID=2631580 RepID=UPI0035C77B2A
MERRLRRKPTLTLLVRELDSNDTILTILVPINPIERPGMRRTAAEILNRVNEVSFNATTLKELRMIALLSKVANLDDSEARAGGECASISSAIPL